MTAEKLIKILQQMPKTAKVRFKDYGSDQDLWLDVNWVRYRKGEGIKIAQREVETSEWEYLVP